MVSEWDLKRLALLSTRPQFSVRKTDHCALVRMGSGHVTKDLPCHNNEDFRQNGIRK